MALFGPTVRIPKLFYDDHMARLGGEQALWEVTHTTHNTVTVRMDKAALAGLLADAEWYADKRNHDAEWPGLVQSAKRTVAACRKAVL